MGKLAVMKDAHVGVVKNIKNVMGNRVNIHSKEEGAFGHWRGSKFKGH